MSIIQSQTQIENVHKFTLYLYVEKQVEVMHKIPPSSGIRTEYEKKKINKKRKGTKNMT